MNKLILKRVIVGLLVMVALSVSAGDSTSVAGFYPIAQQGRRVWNFDSGWRFHIGDISDAFEKDYDDASWQKVSIPHSVKLEPAEASGGRNYQGVAWYRKRFIVPVDRAEIYFEAIMGKQEVFVNGKHEQTHYGGYLPVMVHLDRSGLHVGDTCVIAVKADNSDDKSYPPGKTQYTLDFAYHGGIYRDVWLIAKNRVFITDPIEANHSGGGGVFIHYNNITEQSAEVFVNAEVCNQDTKQRVVTVENIVLNADGKKENNATSRISLKPGEVRVVKQKMLVRKPHLWSPESPYLYRMETRVKDGSTTIDGGMTRIGIRRFEFKGQEGFWLNGKRYRQFVGANRHQDFAYVGNAVPNSQQWRDALRLKNAGFNIIRTAHYPQDPSFMDACDELGLFVIVATPGWQYWNKNDPQFEQRVYQNTKDIIRRDRNHPSVLMWEPILNETRYPENFSLNSLQITRDEYPYPYRPAAVADVNSAGVKENYDVVFGWPGDDEKADRPRQCIFTREFGEYVDDWYAHNNLNRASRSWGERPMLLQALSLAQTTSEMYRTTGQFIGGCQWHPFDHQRGYHPDPYWGGIFDAFRQSKYAYYMFASQAPKPMVYIAHEMTQFSDSDVVVFSNCDSVKLSIYDGAKSWTLPVQHSMNKDYNKPMDFKGVWNFWEARNYSYIKKEWQKVKMLAEGFIDGHVVCSEVRMPSRRSNKLRLYADTMGRPLVADGSDFVVVVCEVTDDNGNVRRLAKENIRFSLSGEGRFIDDGTINANPRAVEWGSAPILLQSTRKAGKILVHAEVQYPGTHAPTSADLVIESVPYQGLFCTSVDEGNESQIKGTPKASVGTNNSLKKLTEEEKQIMLKEVEQQQSDFGITN